MREVRMTFGEHLEDLRLRIIYSLLYLLVGVTISMIYGKQLMEVALQPHADAARQHARQVVFEAAAGDVCHGLDAHSRGQQPLEVREVAAVRLEQRLAQRAT